MQKIEETLKKASITKDKKARRRVNTAPDVTPNIDFDTLNNGVTIEQLENLNVPVYQYQTQITIHGQWPDLDRLWVKGYKSLVDNDNGSLGVKYAAIDAGKKSKLVRAARYGDGWSVSRNSSGTEAYKTFRDKSEAVEAYNNTPDSLYVGGKGLYKLMYGYGYIVIISIGIIYESDLWGLISALTEIKSQKELDQKIAENKARLKAKNAKWEAEREAERKEREAKLAPLVENLKNSLDYPIHEGEIKPGQYLSIWKHRYKIEVGLKLWEVWTSSSGKLRYRAVKIKDIDNLPDINRRKGRDWKPRYAKHRILYVLDKPQKTEEAKKEMDISYDRDWTWIKFPDKPADAILDAIKSLGGRWSRKRMAWYIRERVSKERIAAVL